MDSFSLDIDSNNGLPVEKVDAIVDIYISNNKLEASVKIKPPQNGGKNPSMENLAEILASNNITYGIDTQVLENLCENPIYDENIVIARGLYPINGQDGSFQMHIGQKKDSKLREREDGSVDFYNLDNIENISKDQVLCTITLPTEGRDGISVHGSVVPFIKGKPVPSLLGKNTKLSEDGREITAAIDGQVEYRYGKIDVTQTFYIEEDVDSTTGNIKVVGNVIVKGTVLPGFIVEASGNIQVYKGLSSVKLIAGGDIVLNCGITGGNLSCEGNLKSRFIENCRVSVKGDINTDYVMNSKIVCRKSLYAINSIGKIVGGEYLVSENIQARTIGSNANIRTYLEIAIDPAILERQDILKKEIEALETQRDSLRTLIDILEQLGEKNLLSPEKKEALENSIFSYDRVNDLIEENTLELEKIREWIRSKGFGRINCTGMLHTGTFIKIGPMKTIISDPMFSKSIYYSPEGICIEKL